MTIRKDNVVKVIAGSDKGKTGKVLRVFPKLGRIIVEGVSMRKKHQKARRKDQKGQVVELASPIHISNVILADAEKPKKAAKVKKIEAKKAE